MKNCYLKKKKIERVFCLYTVFNNAFSTGNKERHRKSERKCIERNEHHLKGAFFFLRINVMYLCEHDRLMQLFIIITDELRSIKCRSNNKTVCIFTRKKCHQKNR